MICNSTNSVQISFIETLKLIVFSWTIWWCYWQNVLMINEKNNFLTVSWLSGLLSAEIFISTGEWGVQMPPLTSENSYFLRSGPQGATLVMRISRPASDLPHFHKIFRFQLKSDQHVFPVWTAMQLTWLSTSYHDHSSLSCPLISWGSVKTETLPALCNKNNKPIDLIHLRCGWQLTLSGKGRAYMVSQENAPMEFFLVLTEVLSSIIIVTC